MCVTESCKHGLHQSWVKKEGTEKTGKGFRFPSLRGGLVVVSAIGCDHCGQVTEVAESSVENAQHKVVASVAQKKHVNGKVGK